MVQSSKGYIDKELSMDEIYPRIFQSSCKAANDWYIMQACGITHVLSSMYNPIPPFKNNGVTYLVLDEILDSYDQDISQYFA